MLKRRILYNACSEASRQANVKPEGQVRRLALDFNVVRQSLTALERPPTVGRRNQVIQTYRRCVVSPRAATCSEG